MDEQKPKLRTYSEFSFYSPLLDRQAIRLSMSDDFGGEHFAIVPLPETGKSLRELRDRVLMAIESSIDSGLAPGQIPVPKI